MLWWVSEEMVVRKILNEGEARESISAFHYFAEQRGVPIKLPLMDLQDQKLVTSSDIWGGFGDSLSKANKRYNLNTWVQGKNYFSQGEWNANWEVHVLGDVKAFKAHSPNLRALQKAVIASIAKVLANEYAVVAGKNTSEIYITVSDIRNLDDFSQLKNYLDNLFVVKSVEMRHIKNDQVSFKLSLKEDVEKFKKLLALDKKLFEILNTDNSINSEKAFVEAFDLVAPNSNSDNKELEELSELSGNDIEVMTGIEIDEADSSRIELNALTIDSDVDKTALKINYIQYRWAD